MTQQAEVTYGEITEEGLAQMRAKFGKPYFPILQNEVATRDGIRHYCNGIGDVNPLYRSDDYAKGTKYGCIIAPPVFLLAVTCPQGMEGLPGVHAFYCACEWEWYQVIRAEDRFTAADIPVDLIEKQGKMGGRQFLQVNKTVYWNQRGEVVGVNKHSSMRVERGESKERGKQAHITKHHYTTEQMKAIDDAYEAEEIRGSDPRFWEDVNVGDKLTPVVKGPLGHTDIVEFTAGMGGGQGAHRIRREYMKRHPKWGVKDHETGQLEPMADVHTTDSASDAIGVPVAYDFAIQRFSWAGHLFTNWMGDDGFLKKMDAKCIAFNVLGDTQYISGTIVKKYQEGDEYLVEVEMETLNQRGEPTMPGHATISIPSKVRWI